MHHYGEDHFRVTEVGQGFEIEFQNAVTGARIQMRIPRQGALEESGLPLTKDQVIMVARSISHLLRTELRGMGEVAG